MSALTGQGLPEVRRSFGLAAGKRVPAMPLRVLFFHWNGDLYGASRSLLRLTSRLVEEGHSPVVVLGMHGPLASELCRNSVEVRHSRWMAAIERSSLGSVWGLVRLLLRVLVSLPEHAMLMAREKPDLVHTNASVILTSGLVARLMRLPHVWHIRETFSDHPRLWQIYRTIIPRLSQRIVCISECVAQQFDDSVRASQVSVIHNGIPSSEVGPLSRDRVADLREQWGLTGSTTVGVVGRINLARKGQDLLVRAADELAESRVNVRYLFVGSPYPGKEDEELRLRAMVRELGLEEKFVFAGQIRDLAVIYGLLDIVVVPSPVPEPFGNTAPEAMAFGCAVVGSDQGGTAEIVEHGKTGLLFPPGDAKALGACLDFLLGDPAARSEITAAGRAAFRQRFEFDQCYQRIEDVFTAAAMSRNRKRVA